MDLALQEFPAEMNNKPFTLNDALGKRLVDVHFIVYLFQRKIIETLSCQLIFESNEIINITKASDGESLSIKNLEIEELDLDEYGSTKLISYSLFNEPYTKLIVGKIFRSFRRFTSARKNIVGIELNFGKEKISLYNEDDHLIIENHIDKYLSSLEYDIQEEYCS